MHGYKVFNPFYAYLNHYSIFYSNCNKFDKEKKRKEKKNKLLSEQIFYSGKNILLLFYLFTYYFFRQRFTLSSIIQFQKDIEKIAWI